MGTSQKRSITVNESNIKMAVDLNFGDSGKGWDYAVLDIYINGKKTLGFLIDRDDNSDNE